MESGSNCDPSKMDFSAVYDDSDSDSDIDLTPPTVSRHRKEELFLLVMLHSCVTRPAAKLVVFIF